MNVSVLTEDEIRKIIREEISNSSASKNDHPKKKYFLDEAAKYLGLAVPTFRIHQGKIGGVKIGRRWIFTQAELDQYNEKHRRISVDEIRESIE